MSSAETTYFDRILDPLTDCFTPQVARRLAELRADAKTQSRLGFLAARANEGQLTPEEENEYKQSIDAIDVLSILQAKARAYLREHPAA
jgi:hypothetical protein